MISNIYSKDIDEIAEVCIDNSSLESFKNITINIRRDLNTKNKI